MKALRALLASLVLALTFALVGTNASVAVVASADECPANTIAVHVDANALECMMTNPAPELAAECAADGRVPVIIPDGKSVCAKGDSMTMLDGSPIARPTPAVQANVSLGVDEPAPTIPSGGTPVCNDPEHPDLVEVNGKPMCRGATTLICDKEAARADLPEGAINEVWLEDKCVFRFALMN